jgi:predicted amidohydrolase YtcJ
VTESPDRPLLFRDVEVGGVRTDVLVARGQVVAIDRGLSVPAGGEAIDGAGGALLPGLHDHHLHLMATAQARRSLRVGPDEVGSGEDFRRALGDADRTLPSGRWIRAVGYHDSVAGDLDRWALDAVVVSRPVRIQHRSGARWLLNSAALAELSLGEVDDPAIERTSTGEPTGRIHRGDHLMGRRRSDTDPPDLAELGALLVARGVTGVTDATPYERLDDLRPIAAAVADGTLPLRVVVTGGLGLLGETLPDGLELGPVKLVIDEATSPPLSDLVDGFGAAHRHRRPVAVHCVTRASLYLALAAWKVAGAAPGDRIEHGSVIPEDAIGTIAQLGLTVVTQPGFVGERGDQYLRDVDADDLEHLYRCATLLDAGIPVGLSTDAPFTDPDPWAAIAAAVRRRTRSGETLGPRERLVPRAALDGFLSDPHDPGGPPRRIVPGAPAELCLLHGPLSAVLERPHRDAVRRVTTPRPVRGGTT